MISRKRTGMRHYYHHLTIKKKKRESTFDRMMKDPEPRKNFEEGYREFLISELLLALMEEDDISVRKLAKEAGVSPKLIQDILIKLEELFEDGKNIQVLWFYEEEDEDMMDSGEEFMEMTDVPFEMIGY